MDVLRGLAGETSAWKSTLLRRGGCRGCRSILIVRSMTGGVGVILQELCASWQQDHRDFVGKRLSAPGGLCCGS